MSSLWVGWSQDNPMGQWVKDVGKSEGYAVTAWIAVQDLPHLKRGRIPTGVSSRERWANDLNGGKQMTADFGLAGAPLRRNAWLLPSNIVKSVQLYWRVFPSRRAFEMLEPIALKGARWVLRGEGGGNAAFLPDQPNASTRLIRQQRFWWLKASRPPRFWFLPASADTGVISPL